MIAGPDDPRFQSLVQGFANKLRKCGMAIPPGSPPVRPVPLVPTLQDDASRSQSIRLLRESMTGAGRPSFMLVLLEARDNAIYPAIKVEFLPYCEVI
jgi:hypothetical protein